MEYQTIGDHIKTSSIRSWTAAPVEEDIIVLWRLWCTCRRWSERVYECVEDIDQKQNRENHMIRDLTSETVKILPLVLPRPPQCSCTPTYKHWLVSFNWYFFATGFCFIKKSAYRYWPSVRIARIYCVVVLCFVFTFLGLVVIKLVDTETIIQKRLLVRLWAVHVTAQTSF